MTLIVRVKKKKHEPCEDCAYKASGACRKVRRCDNYIPITPTCNNCGKQIGCKLRPVNRKCKKWEPDPDSPFLSVVKELADLRRGELSRGVSLIDDRDFKQAPNFITFCLDYLQIKPFPKQIEEGSFFFGDICFHCSNPAYQNLYDENLGDILDNMVFLEYGVCPICKRNRFQLMKKYPEKMAWYQELVGVAGQRSGKSELAAQMSAYVWHWYTKLSDNPSKFYGLLNTRLHMTFTALTYGQAKKNLWNPFYDYLKDSKWFNDYHRFLKEKCYELGIEDVLKFPDTFITYKHKNLECAPVGPDKRVLRGPTRMLMCIAGNSLVNTGKGLIPIEQDLSGLTASVNNNLVPINKSWKTGNKKVSILYLDKGYNLTGTKEHEILILSRTFKLIWKGISELKIGDNVVLNYGGSFPNKLHLRFVDDYDIPVYKKVMLNMARLKTFTKLEVIEGIPDAKHIYDITSKLIKNGMLNTKGNKKRPGFGRYHVYSITDKFDVNFFDSKHLSIKFPTELTHHLGYIMGYLVSEGNYAGISSEIEFSNTNKKVVHHYIKCFEKTFGILPDISSYNTKQGTKAWSIRTSNKRIKLFLRYLGLNGVNSRKKVIPWCILQAPRKIAIAFLKALYEGDGTFQEYYVGYYSRSSKLLRQLQILLLKFGIVSRYEKHGLITASKYDAHIFSKEIGAITKSNNINFNDLTCTHYRIPNIEYSWAGNRNSKGHIYVKSELNEILDDYPLNRLKKENKLFYDRIIKIIDSGIFFLQVKGIRHTDKKIPVYDLEVNSKEHAFVANGIVVHNCIDELGWFTGTKSAIKINPDEVYNALSNSLATLRGQAEHLRRRRKLFHLPTAYAINISSPSSARDKIMRLLYQSRKIKNIHAFHLPTWEMNPDLPRDNDLFETEFQKNPGDANRDFGAFPPLTERPFIAELSPIWEVASQTKKNMFDYTLVMIRSKSGKEYVSVRMNRIKTRNRPLLIGVDAGRSGNAFAIVATSYNTMGQVVLEGIIEVKPLPNLPVNFLDVWRKALRPILKTQTVVALLVDQWQSIDLVDKVDDEFGDDTEAIRYSLKYGDFEDARQRLLGEQVIIPMPEVKDWSKILKGIEEYEEYFVGRPISHLYLQLATVQDSGRRVEKSGDLDDDLFRALMLCVRFTFDEKDGYKYELMTITDDQDFGNRMLGIVRGKTMGDRLPRRAASSTVLARTSLGQVVGRSGRTMIGMPQRIPKRR